MQLSISSFNVDTNLFRLEDGPFIKSHEAWRIHNRLKDIFSVVSHYKPDIVLFQECRNCLNSHGELIDSVTPIVKYLEENNYIALITKYNPSEKAFIYITGIKKEFKIIDKFSYYLTKTPFDTKTPEQLEEYRMASKDEFPEVKKKWININCGEEFEKSVAVCLLEDLGGKKFVVVNTHLGMNKEHRLYACAKLNLFAERYRSIPIIIAGDFNSFPDDGGFEQIMQFTHFKDATNDMPVVADYRKSDAVTTSKNSTFISFPYDFAYHSFDSSVKDEMKKILDLDRQKDYEKISEIQKGIFNKLTFDNYPLGGHLDHVMFKGIEPVSCRLVLAWCHNVSSCNFDSKALHELINRTPGPIFASDHQFVFAVFTL